jgi:FKBP-type peptidyl-prolyl cis-trans isomerase
MATTKTQRIGIWVIAAFMAVGTIGSFAIIVLANQNGQRDQAHINELMEDYQKESAEYQAKVDAQAKELSDEHYGTFNKYAKRPASFDATSIKELTSVDLEKGDGETLTNESTFTAYYLGWTPDGKVFDGSIDGKSLKAPITAAPGGVIKGWTDGVAGMKVGGVRELSIPADLAYGESGSGDSIPPNSPLKFVVMVIPTPEEIPQPEMSQELMNYYSTGRLQ